MIYGHDLDLFHYLLPCQCKVIGTVVSPESKVETACVSLPKSQFRAAEIHFEKKRFLKDSKTSRFLTKSSPLQGSQSPETLSWGCYEGLAHGKRSANISTSVKKSKNGGKERNRL